MSKELKPCPVCGGYAEIRNVGYEDQRPQCVMSNCRIGSVETFHSSEQATRYWNKLIRLDEKRKAEIAIQMIRECVLYIPASLPKEDIEALEYAESCIAYAYGLDEKAKGWE